MHFLRGMDSLFIDLYTNRDHLVRLAEGLAAFNLEMIKGWKNAGVDAVFFGDDWGFQDRLMINPKLWKELFKPWYKKFFQAVHDEDLQVWFHSCGNVLDIVKDLIECGVDVLNPLQPRAMDLNALAKRFRGKLSFHGGIDCQFTLPKCTPEEVALEVKKHSRLLNTERGGYIGGPSTTIMPETPLENIIAMCEAFR
jgi:uroporphyrinogen decarboxylase